MPRFKLPDGLQGTCPGGILGYAIRPDTAPGGVSNGNRTGFTLRRGAFGAIMRDWRFTPLTSIFDTSHVHYAEK
jgi:hypothetical protein